MFLTVLVKSLLNSVFIQYLETPIAGTLVGEFSNCVMIIFWGLQDFKFSDFSTAFRKSTTNKTIQFSCNTDIL